MLKNVDVFGPLHFRKNTNRSCMDLMLDTDILPEAQKYLKTAEKASVHFNHKTV